MTRPRNIRRTIEGYILLFLVCGALAGLLCLVPSKQPPQQPLQESDTAAVRTIYERDFIDQAPGEYCYICTGRRSRKYHTTPTCPSSCRRRILRITVAEAIKKGYELCHTCH